WRSRPSTGRRRPVSCLKLEFAAHPCQTHLPRSKLPVVKVVTTEQMRELDRRTIAAGTPAEELMERAGFAVAKAAIEFLKRRDSRSALLFAGNGNNGGDAIVAARHLAAAGCRP